MRDHPNGDRIWLADVDLGRGDPVQIVFGGIQLVVQPESLVPVAPPGSRLNGVKMRRRRYRGETSHGMLCSLAELGWDPTVTDQVATLVASVGLQPGSSLDDCVFNWKSIVRNPRSERSLRLRNTIRPIWSGVWRPGKRGTLKLSSPHGIRTQDEG